MTGTRRVRHSGDKASARAKAPAPVLRRPSSSGSAADRLLRMQSLAGNGATLALLQRDDDLVEGAGKVTDTVDALGGTGGTFSSFGGITGAQYQQGNANSPTSDAGAGFGIIGSLTGGTSVVTNSIQIDSARKELREEQEAGRGGEAKARGATRDLKTGSANVTQAVLNTAGQPFNVMSGVAQHLSNSGVSNGFTSAGNTLGGVGGAITLPAALINSVRMGRKTVKQYARFRKLRKGVEDPETKASDAVKALQKQKEAVTALEATHQAAVEELEEARRALSLARKAKQDTAGPMLAVAERRQAVSDLQDLIEAAEVEVTNAEAAKISAEQALADYHARAAAGEESPADIRAYAMGKNSAGWRKKLVSTVAGFVGVGGGLAATLASFAAAGLVGGVAVTAATPVGWALCGAAAVAGLALAGYAFWKWASKRYQRLVDGGAEKGFKTFLKSINPFAKGIPDSRRQKLAVRLYELAAGTAPDATPADTAEAKIVITDLGLDWGSLKMSDHRDSAIKLIHAKMAS